MEVTSITNGIIIDHVDAGTALTVLHYLKVDPTTTKLALIMNASSHALGAKDIIKLEDVENLNLDALGFIAPRATVNTCAAAKSSTRRSRNCLSIWSASSPVRTRAA